MKVIDYDENISCLAYGERKYFFIKGEELFYANENETNVNDFKSLGGGYSYIDYLSGKWFVVHNNVLYRIDNLNDWDNKTKIEDIEAGEVVYSTYLSSVIFIAVKCNNNIQIYSSTDFGYTFILFKTITNNSTSIKIDYFKKDNIFLISENNTLTNISYNGKGALDYKKYFGDTGNVAPSCITVVGNELLFILNNSLKTYTKQDGFKTIDNGPAVEIISNKYMTIVKKNNGYYLYKNNALETLKIPNEINGYGIETLFLLNSNIFAYFEHGELHKFIKIDNDNSFSKYIGNYTIRIKTKIKNNWAIFNFGGGNNSSKIFIDDDSFKIVTIEAFKNFLDTFKENVFNTTAEITLMQWNNGGE